MNRTKAAYMFLVTQNPTLYALELLCKPSIYIPKPLSICGCLIVIAQYNANFDSILQLQ